ncbi:MAG: hypothetical protein HQL53_06840, partial [Magnetococcales bacterium]|nr:hypothetical protein [Magnetococcales bacterium]
MAEDDIKRAAQEAHADEEAEARQELDEMTVLQDVETVDLSAEENLISGDGDEDAVAGSGNIMMGNRDMEDGRASQDNSDQARRAAREAEAEEQEQQDRQDLDDMTVLQDVETVDLSAVESLMDSSGGDMEDPTGTGNIQMGSRDGEIGGAAPGALSEEAKMVRLQEMAQNNPDQDRLNLDDMTVLQETESADLFAEQSDAQEERDAVVEDLQATSNIQTGSRVESDFFASGISQDEIAAIGRGQEIVREELVDQASIQTSADEALTTEGVEVDAVELDDVALATYLDEERTQQEEELKEEQEEVQEEVQEEEGDDSKREMEFDAVVVDDSPATEREEEEGEEDGAIALNVGADLTGTIDVDLDGEADAPTLVITNGSGDDAITEGVGDDTMDGGAGDDLVTGGAGDDTLSDGEGDDALYGGDGSDLLAGGAGDDVLGGDAEDDTIQRDGSEESVAFEWNLTDYTISQNDDGSFSVSHDDGTDTVYNVENFEFADQTIGADDLLQTWIDAMDTEASDPTLTAVDTTGTDDTAIALDVSFELQDIGGSDSISSDGITMTGVPEGATLSVGTDNGDGTWTISVDDLSVTSTNDDDDAVAWEVPNLTITPAPNDDTDFSLGVSVTTSDGADTYTAESTMDVADEADADGLRFDTSYSTVEADFGSGRTIGGSKGGGSKGGGSKGGGSKASGTAGGGSKASGTAGGGSKASGTAGGGSKASGTAGGGSKAGGTTGGGSIATDDEGLVLNVGKGGKGNTGEFEVIINGETVGTYTTDEAHNASGEWESIRIDGVDTSNIESITI